jgi:hypothetical protein
MRKRGKREIRDIREIGDCLDGIPVFPYTHIPIYLFTDYPVHQIYCRVNNYS